MESIHGEGWSLWPRLFCYLAVQGHSLQGIEFDGRCISTMLLKAYAKLGQGVN